MTSQRPSPNDAADYYFTYINRVPDGNVIERLASQIVQTAELTGSISEDQASYRYQPDRWSVKEVLGHVADAERVFAYRALAFSRGDEQPIPGMEQDQWMDAARFDEQSIAEVVADLVAIRQSTVTLFRGFSPTQWRRRGLASDVEFQAGAIAWIIAGHELHHRAVLEKRYGLGS